MIPAEMTALARHATKLETEVRKLRVALSKISDITSERMRTKTELQVAMDRIGVLASEAIVATNS